jgi:hypothetical protein
MANVRAGTKTAKILDLLKRPGGATARELMKVTGLQPHSARGFLSTSATLDPFAPPDSNSAAFSRLRRSADQRPFNPTECRSPIVLA